MPTATTPKAATPKAATPKAATPKAATPKAATPKAAGSSGSDDRAAKARNAAAMVWDKHTLTINLPDNLGTIRLPGADRLAFYGGIAALGAFGVIEWPVAVLLGVGHALAEDHHHRCLSEFGEALAEAD